MVALYPEGWLKKAGTLAFMFWNCGSFSPGLFIAGIVGIIYLAEMGLLQNERK